MKHCHAVGQCDLRQLGMFVERCDVSKFAEHLISVNVYAPPMGKSYILRFDPLAVSKEAIFKATCSGAEYQRYGSASAEGKGEMEATAYDVLARNITSHQIAESDREPFFRLYDRSEWLERSNIPRIPAFLLFMMSKKRREDVANDLYDWYPEWVDQYGKFGALLPMLLAHRLCNWWRRVGCSSPHRRNCRQIQRRQVIYRCPRARK
jgi:hypothetical protein